MAESSYTYTASNSVSDDFTTMLWVKDSGATTGIIASLGSSSPVEISCTDTTVTLSGSTVTLDSVDLNDGEWHHLAIVYDDSGNSGDLYVDGTIQTTGFSVSLSGFDTTIKFGENKTFKGSDFRVYSKVLDGPTIQYYYSNVINDGGNAVMNYA